MRHTLARWLLAVPIVSAGCRGTNEAPASIDGVTLDGDDAQVRATPEGDGDDFNKVPVSLWSPEQRRSTASYYYLVAEYMSLKDRDIKKALPIFETAYGLDPNPFLGGKMLVAKSVAGDRAEALLEARKMVLLYPQDPNLRYFYGQMLVEASDLDEAVTQLERCVDLDPTMEVAFLLLTQVYQTKKEHAKALVVAKELVKKVPGSATGWTVLSRIYLTMGQHKEALVPARRAWEMQSNNPQLTQIYAIVLQMNGKTEQAIRLYEQLYAMDPTDEQLNARMVQLYRDIGNLESALTLLDELSKSNGQRRPAAQMQKAILLWELKRNKEAVELLDQLVKDFPESDKVLYLAGFGNERMARYERAFELYSAIQETSSVRRDADVRALGVLRAQKKFDAGRPLAEKILKSEPAWEVYGPVAGFYADADSNDEALRVVEEGLKRFPDNAKILFLKGVYQEKAGDNEGCIATMRQVIEKDPQNSSAYNFIGYMYADRGENLDEAEQLIQQALKLKPDDPYYLDSLGWVYYQKGELDRALPILEKAANLEPKEGVFLEHIGDVRLKKGERKVARELFERALKLELEARDRSRIQKKVQDLGASE